MLLTNDDQMFYLATLYIHVHVVETKFYISVHYYVGISSWGGGAGGMTLIISLFNILDFTNSTRVSEMS